MTLENKPSSSQLTGALAFAGGAFLGSGLLGGWPALWELGIPPELHLLLGVFLVCVAVFSQDRALSPAVAAAAPAVTGPQRQAGGD